MMNSSLRKVFGKVARVCCEEFVKRIVPRLIMDREGGSVYLERYYIFGGPSEEREWADTPIGVYLHRFCRSDDDSELHNHPWDGAVSFILAGGYDEERRIPGDDVVKRRFEPFSFNVIMGNDFHRVDLLERDAWSIFVVGRKAQSWGFWNRETKLFSPWREFVARKRGVDPATITDNIKRSEDVGATGQ